MLKSRQPNGRESVFVHSSVEWRLAGQRRGAEEGVMGRNWYYEEWGGQERIWSGQEAQVECGYTEPERKDFRQRKKRKL